MYLREPSALPAPLLRLFNKKQYAKCLPELQLLAEQGSIEAVIAMAHIHFYGGNGVRKNYTLARHWLEIANERGYFTYVVYRLAAIYYRGLGVIPDHRLAYQFFRKSGLKGHLESLVMIGSMQKGGDGVIRKPRSGNTLLFHCARNRKLGFVMRVFALGFATGVLSCKDRSNNSFKPKPLRGSA